jgi:hypothetical protein
MLTTLYWMTLSTLAEGNVNIEMISQGASEIK